MRNFISILFIYFCGIFLVTFFVSSNDDFAYLLGVLSAILAIPTFLAYFFRLPTIIIAILLAIHLGNNYQTYHLTTSQEYYYLILFAYFIGINIFSFFIANIIKECLEYNKKHPSVIYNKLSDTYIKAKKIYLQYWRKSNISKAIMVAVPLLIVILGYGCKVYLDKDEILTRAATKKYNYCMQQRRWGLKTYLASKCPEYLYYMNSCYGECKSTAIKKIKEKL